MSQAHVTADLSDWAVQFAFIGALLFTVLYGFLLHIKWRETVTGRSLFTLGPSIAGALLGRVLILWRVPVIHLTGNGYTAPWYGWVLTWLSLIGVFGAGTVCTVLAWQSLRFAVAEQEWADGRMARFLLWIKGGRHMRK